MTPTTDQLKDLLAKVTPAPWVIKFRKDGSAYMSMGGVNRGDAHSQFDIGLDDSYPRDQYDATLIALAPTLAAEVVRLREALADMLFEYGGRYDKDCLVKDNHVLAMIDRARQALDATRAK